MRDDDWTEEAKQVFREKIKELAALAAFDALVGYGESSPVLAIGSGTHGYVESVALRDAISRKWPFAFTCNVGHLLFYVRPPAVRTLKITADSLSQWFRVVKTLRRATEFTIRIETPEETRRVIEYVLEAWSPRAVAPSPTAPKFWWVNHKQTHRQEIEGEYLWSPKVNRNGANNESYNNMVRTQPGDVVFSFAGGEIRAVGLVKGPAVEAPKPLEFGAVGDQWSEDLGWAVPVKFALLKSPLDIQAHASELAPVLPPKHSPIQANGHGNQGTYLAAVPGPMADVLRGLIGPALDEELGGLTLLMGSAYSDDVAESRLQQRTDIGPTQKKTLVAARRGQGIYRENLESVESSCRVTGLSDRRHLRASHIKPWRDCDDRERLDGFNGLLLSPHIDHLFDQGHISFTDEGETLMSRRLNPAVLKRWGLVMPRNVGPFAAEQCVYLAYHRAKIFEKDAGGRRAG